MVAIAAAAASAAIGAYGAGTFTLAAFASRFAISMALSFVSKALQPKPKKQEQEQGLSGITQQFRQPIIPRNAVYGEVRTSGGIIYAGTSGPTNKYLNMVIVIAAHEIEAFDEFIIEDQSITPDMIDGSGIVTSGRYANFVQIKTHLGATAQTADTDLIAQATEWTVNHRLRGCAYIYVRYETNSDVFPNGIPNISAWVRGKKCLDSRDFIISTQLEGQDGEYIVGQDGSPVIGLDNSSEAVRAWTPNAALHALDNITDTELGCRVPLTRIDDDAIDEAANICDEFVQTRNAQFNATSADPTLDTITIDADTLQYFRGDIIQFTTTTIGGVSTATDYYVIPYQRHDTMRIRLATSIDAALAGAPYVNITASGVGTIIKTQEPRYHGGGVITMDNDRWDNLSSILSGMGGKAERSGGRFFIRAMAYRTPIYSFGVDDLIGGITLQTKVSSQTRFNRVIGNYRSQINLGVPADYPEVKSDTYTAADGGEKKRRQLNLAFAVRPQQAQRIAKTFMETERQEIRYNAKFNISAVKLKIGDTFYFTMSEYGWSSKVFEVEKFSMAYDDENGVRVPVVQITAKETASAAYSFTSATDESAVDPAINSTLPDVHTVSVVTGFSLDSIPVSTLGGDTTYKILASWDAHPDYYVTQGGKFEIEYKLTSATAWTKAAPVDGGAVQTELFQAELDTTYDIRIRAINNLGVKSNYSLIEEFVVGLTGGITSREDWESGTVARSDTDWESATATSEDWE